MVDGYMSPMGKGPLIPKALRCKSRDNIGTRIRKRSGRRQPMAGGTKTNLVAGRRPPRAKPPRLRLDRAKADKPRAVKASRNKTSLDGSRTLEGFGSMSPMAKGTPTLEVLRCNLHSSIGIKHPARRSGRRSRTAGGTKTLEPGLRQPKARPIQSRAGTARVNRASRNKTSLDGSRIPEGFGYMSPTDTDTRMPEAHRCSLHSNTGIRHLARRSGRRPQTAGGIRTALARGHRSAKARRVMSKGLRDKAARPR